MLNGNTYVVDRLISMSTGEAEVFLVRQGDVECIFKLYYPNFKPKDAVIEPLKQLRHDDIVNLIDYGYWQGRFFELMEYAQGGTVDQYLPIRDIRQIRALVAECVNAFRFCHDHGIVHKDIKPANLYYKSVNQTDIAIGDFGISSMLDAGMSRHLTSQSLTVGYAAPEMYGIGGKVYVGREVDYYALGVTLIHVWAGRSPFDGLGIHAIANLTTTGAIKVPDDLPKDLQTLVRGLTTVDFAQRWGFEEVQRWLKGEDVPVHAHAVGRVFPAFHFSVREEAASCEALAALLKGNPTVGKKLLYSGKISAWVNVFDHALATELDKIVEEDYPRNQDAGHQKAIYLLDPDQPYDSNQRSCRTAQELAVALEDGFSFYGPLLSNPHHAFYLYLEAHGGKKEADTFRSYFQTFSATKALNATILELSGTTSVVVLGRQFATPEEVLAARDQSTIVEMLKDPESKLSVWMERTSSTTVRSRLVAWRALPICDSTTLALVSETSDGVPTLELSRNRISLSDLRLGSTIGDSVEVRNVGEGRLTGAISVDRAWLHLANTAIDPSQKTQTIAFTISTAHVAYGATDCAVIEVRTNVGTETVTVAIAIEQGAQAIARFRKTATMSAAAVGAVLGLTINGVSSWLESTTPWALAGLLGVAGLALHVAAARKELGQTPAKPAMMAFASGLMVWWGLFLSPVLLSSALSWSLLSSVVVYALAPKLLATLQVTRSRTAIPVALVAAAGALCSVVIVGDRQLQELIRQGEVWRVNQAGKGSSQATGLGTDCESSFGPWQVMTPPTADTAVGTVYKKSGAGGDPSLSFGGWSDEYFVYVRFELGRLPPAADVTSVKICLFATGVAPNDPQLQIGRIVEPWESRLVTIDARPSATDFVAIDRVSDGWNVIEATNLYRFWKANPGSNFGFELRAKRTNQTNGQFASSDSPSSAHRPRLIVKLVDDKPRGAVGGPPATDNSAPDAEERRQQQVYLKELNDLMNQTGTNFDGAGQDAMKRYLEHGGDPTVRIGGNWSLLNVAAQNGYRDVVESVLAHGVDINSKSDDGTPLYWTIVSKRPAMALYLIERGADVNLAKSGGWRPLHVAESELDPQDPLTQDVIAALVQRGARKK